MFFVLSLNLTGYMESFALKICRTALMVLFLAAFVVGCDDPQKDSRSFEDFVRYLSKSGLKIDGMRALPGETIHAQYAAAFMVSGREFAVYKFDPTKKKALSKIEKIDEGGFVYIVGIKYPAIRNGSFLLIDYEGNTSKDKIIKMFKDF